MKGVPVPPMYWQDPGADAQALQFSPTIPGHRWISDGCETDYSDLVSTVYPIQEEGAVRHAVIGGGPELALRSPDLAGRHRGRHLQVDQVSILSCGSCARCERR
jgi:hypothetical protein